LRSSAHAKSVFFSTYVLSRQKTSEIPIGDQLIRCATSSRLLIAVMETTIGRLNAPVSITGALIFGDQA
jgi:hypothetical protein